MYNKSLSKKTGLIFLIIMTLICSSNFVSCSSRMVIVPDKPGAYEDPADYADLGLVISRFDVVYIDKSADREDVPRLRKEFMSYLAAQNYFSSVTDSETSDTDINRYLKLEVEITPEYTTNRTWILDVMTFYPFLGLWPITPHWGEVKVFIKVDLFDPLGGHLSSLHSTKKVDYSNTFYSYYRTAPVENAFHDCYNIAFKDISSQLRTRQAVIMAALDIKYFDRVPQKSFQERQDSDASKLNIAVIDLDAYGVSPTDVLSLSNRLTTELFKTDRFTVLERSKMQDILTEQGFQQTGCTTSECLVEAGRLLNVHQIVGGSIGKVGELYTVELRLIDVESGQIISVANEDIGGDLGDVLTSGIRNATYKLIRQVF